MHFINYKVKFRNSIRKFLFFLNALSIDIAISALAGFLAVNKVFGQPQHISMILLLVLSVLLVYWFDHLLDVFKYGKRISNRHFYLTKYQPVLKITGLLFLVLVCFIAVFQLSLKALILGLLLGILAWIYLLFHTNRLLQKEPFAAAIYTAGIYFQVLLNPEFWPFCFFGYFFLLTLYAMYLIAMIEQQTDKQYGVPNSFVKRTFVNGLFWLLLGIGILLASVKPMSSFGQLIGAYLLILSILKIIDLYFYKSVFIRKYYRYIIEWSFLIPWLMV